MAARLLFVYQATSRGAARLGLAQISMGPSRNGRPTKRMQRSVGKKRTQIQPSRAKPRRRLRFSEAWHSLDFFFIILSRFPFLFYIWHICLFISSGIY